MNTPPNPTNSRSNPSPGDDMGHLESDLLPILADLDRLARTESAADAGFEDRLMQATLGPLHGVQPVAAQVAELGALDRAVAPQDLEQTVFEASVPALHESAPPRLVLHAASESRDERRHARVVRRSWWSSAPVRMAAAIALVAGTTIAFRTAYTPKPAETPADKVSREMDVLFAVVEHANSDAKDADATPDYDPDKLSEWLSEGAAS